MQKTILSFITALALLVSSSALAQHEHHAPDHSQEQEHDAAVKYTCPMHPEVVSDEAGKCPKCGMTLAPTRESKRSTSNVQRLTSKSEHTGYSERQSAKMERGMAMHSSINIADPMNREGSGTAWLPDSTPMYGRMFMFGDDMLMLHGGIFPRYTNVNTRRGDDRIDAPNWIMAMYSHPFSDSTQLGGRLMMSLDPLTEGGRGYPLLLQSGESWHDQPLHDRQHPHDLFDELSLSLSQKFTQDVSGYLYFGYPGEPALGPPTFMHRLSAMDDPDAPIGHHWQDSTHVTFGVATGGLQWRTVKIEGSIFTGREPDEERYDFDRPRFDSYSGRISWNPTPNLALQFSHAYIRSPEALEPDLNRHRTTASAIYNLPLGNDINWSNSFVWGKNNDSGEKTNSFLLESNYQRRRDTIYGRWELVEKSGHELVLPDVDLEKVFTVNAVSLGYVRDLTHGNGIDIGAGVQGTLDFWPGGLDRYYGDEIGYGFQVFLRIRPSVHSHSGHQEHEIAGTAK